MLTTTEKPITEKTVRDRLLRMFPPHQSLVAFNVTCIHGHEMDFFRVTGAGYGQEFEIKVSRADLRAELDKADKHSDLLDGWERGVGEVYQKCPAYPDGVRLNDVLIERLRPDQLCEPYQPTTGDKWHRRTLQVRYRHAIREFYVALPAETDLSGFACDILPAWMGIVALPDKPCYWKDVVVRPAMKLPHHRKITDEERRAVATAMNYKSWRLYFDRACGRG